MVNAPLQLTGHIPIELSEDGGFGLLWREILGNTDTYMDEDATILEGSLRVDSDESDPGILEMLESLKAGDSAFNSKTILNSISAKELVGSVAQWSRTAALLAGLNADPKDPRFVNLQTPGRGLRFWNWLVGLPVEFQD